MVSSFRKDCMPKSRVVYRPCSQSQRSNLVSCSALCLEQVNLLWIFPTGSLNFTGGGDAINCLFRCLTSPILLLSGWNFLCSSLSQLHLLLLLGLIPASLHTPNRQLQAAMAAALQCLPSKAHLSMGGSNSYWVSCHKRENPPILKMYLLHQEASGWGLLKLSLGLGEVKM